MLNEQIKFEWAVVKVGRTHFVDSMLNWVQHEVGTPPQKRGRAMTYRRLRNSAVLELKQVQGWRTGWEQTNHVANNCRISLMGLGALSMVRGPN